MRRVGIAVIALVLLAATARADDLRVMTFNIRVASANDGPDAWPLRRDLLIATVQKFDPDLLGLQEVEPDQANDLTARLKDYRIVGDVRDNRSPLMYRRERFEPVRSGSFWLSETPDVAGSKGWDSAYPRVCTWIELRDHRSDDRALVYFNTHWDHKSAKARIESATLMRSRIADIARDKPVIITGDFNSSHKSTPHQVLLENRFVDAFAEAHPHPTTRQFTFHGFTGQSDQDDRIDWILRSSAFRTRNADIDRTSANGRYPSDHFPVEAVLEWLPEKAPAATQQ